jgi:hypothetical protein
LIAPWGPVHHRLHDHLRRVDHDRRFEASLSPPRCWLYSSSGSGCIAVLLDATLIRMVLVPAIMHIAGRWNWWPGVRAPRREADVEEVT